MGMGERPRETKMAHDIRARRRGKMTTGKFPRAIAQ
jgi:hypothetical protein